MVVVACSEDENFDFKIQDDLSISTLNGTWRVVAYKELDTKKVIIKDSINSWGMDIIITFDDSINPAEVKGRNTTNSIFGKFIYINDRSFRILELGTTEVNQPEWANRFVDLVLESELVFEVNENQLLIINEQNQLSALLEKNNDGNT